MPQYCCERRRVLSDANRQTLPRSDAKSVLRQRTNDNQGERLMAASPRFKIYNNDNQYIGCMHDISDCVLAIADRKGCSIRQGHAKKNIIWHEGHESQPSSESFDFVIDLCNKRLNNSANPEG